MDLNDSKRTIETIVSRHLEGGDRFVVTEEADAHEFVVTIYRGIRNASFRVKGSEVAVDFATDPAGLERLLEGRMYGTVKRLQ